MFEHLDDPNAPQPTNDRLSAIVNGSRTRHRLRITGVAGSLAVVIIAAMVVASFATGGNSRNQRVEVASPTTKATGSTVPGSEEPLSPAQVLRRVIPEIENLGFPIADDAIQKAINTRDEQRRTLEKQLRTQRPGVSIDRTHADPIEMLGVNGGDELSTYMGQEIPSDMHVYPVLVSVMTTRDLGYDWSRHLPIQDQVPGATKVAIFGPGCSMWKRDNRSTSGLFIAAACPQGVLLIGLAGQKAFDAITVAKVESLARIGFGLDDGEATDESRTPTTN